jgi:signal transduction histidine kinase
MTGIIDGYAPEVFSARGADVVRTGLTRRALVAGVALALVVGAAFAVLLSSIAALHESQQRLQGSAQVLVAANRLERLLVDIETGQRGFALTGEERFLQPWRGASAAFPDQGRELERLVAEDPDQLAHVRRINAAGESYIRDYSAPLVEATRRDPAAGRSAAAAAEGKRLVDAMRADFDRLLTARQSAAERERHSSDDDARRAAVAGAVGLVGSLLLIAVYTAYLTRAVVTPVRRVAAAASRIAGGDLTARVADGGAGEVGVLERSFNTMAGTLAHNRDELRASRERIVTAADQARRRIERDLHDGIQQRLVSLVLDIRGLQDTIPSDLDAGLDQLSRRLNDAVDELREVSRGIHPAILSDAGLGPALRALARRSPVPVDLDLQLQVRLPEPVEVAAYYVASEGLTNAAKHARATTATVTADIRDGVLHLEIRDDGAGGAAAGEGSGLVGLIDRVEALGGTLTLISPAGRGTRLVVDLPTDGR